MPDFDQPPAMTDRYESVEPPIGGYSVDLPVLHFYCVFCSAKAPTGIKDVVDATEFAPMEEICIACDQPLWSQYMQWLASQAP